MSLVKIIENNFFAIGSYWGAINSSISGNGKISSMNTGIEVADLNWTWNERPLTGNDLRIINQIKNKYKDLKLHFWWWVYPCGQSATTNEALQNEGLNYLESIPCLALEVITINHTMTRCNDIEISFVKDEKELKMWGDISFTGFEMPLETRMKYNKFVMSFDISARSPQKLFVAYFMGQPVATSLLFLHGDNAGVYFVTTLPEYRNKGIASALILNSIKYTKTAGYKYCILQSSKDGLAVYKRAGFQECCCADIYSLPESRV